MIDLMFLPSKEVAVIDTSTAITSIVLIYGAVNIVDANGNVVATLQNDIEIYTIPANSGKYTIRNDTDYNSKVAVVRMFYI
ncbi:MAG: hypothetical protein ACP5JX_04160 [Sulfurihydrogenibium sp.]